MFYYFLNEVILRLKSLTLSLQYICLLYTKMTHILVLKVCKTQTPQ